MVMPGRSYIQENQHRYGFNGKELDPEGMGGGLTTYEYGFRIYNPAIAKFLSVDLLESMQCHYSPYSFAGNSPILCLDFKGLFKIVNSTSAEKQNQYPHLQLAVDRLVAISTNLDYLLRITRDIETKSGIESQNIRDYIQKTSGLEGFEIANWITLGKGPTIEIVDGTEGENVQVAFTKSKDLIQIDVDALQALGDASLSEADLASLVLYWGVTMLHEMCHAGDKKTNDGVSTGENWSGKETAPGKQDYQRSPFGHRGSDFTLAFFGNIFVNSLEDHTYEDKFGGTSIIVPAGMDLQVNIESNKRRTGLSDKELAKNAKTNTKTMSPKKTKPITF